MNNMTKKATAEFLKTAKFHVVTINTEINSYETIGGRGTWMGECTPLRAFQEAMSLAAAGRTFVILSDADAKRFETEQYGGHFKMIEQTQKDPKFGALIRPYATRRFI